MSLQTEADTLHVVVATVRNTSAKPPRSWFILSNASATHFPAGARSSSWKVCLTELVDSNGQQLSSHLLICVCLHRRDSGLQYGGWKRPFLWWRGWENNRKRLLQWCCCQSEVVQKQRRLLKPGAVPNRNLLQIFTLLCEINKHNAKSAKRESFVVAHCCNHFVFIWSGKMDYHITSHIIVIPNVKYIVKSRKLFF